MDSLEALVERIDRLLVKHQELQRTNVLLQEQLLQAIFERDAARQRLAIAGRRMDVLIAQLQPGERPNNLGS